MKNPRVGLKAILVSCLSACSRRHLSWNTIQQLINKTIARIKAKKRKFILDGVECVVAGGMNGTGVAHFMDQEWISADDWNCGESLENKEQFRNNGKFA
jgi:hypothetical protein